MEDDISPTGPEVVQTGVRGLGDFFRQLGGQALRGVSGRIDLELAERIGQAPSTADVAPIATQTPAPPGFLSVIQNLTTGQVLGLVAAGALTFGLATGRFR